MPTQDERRAATRAKLLDATVEALVDLGYAGASTTEIVKRAGVSQGALFKHFSTKAELLAAAMHELFGRLRVAYLEVAADAFEDAADGDVIGPAVDALWQVYERPDLHAVLELYLAARTDDELRAALAEVEGPHREELRAVGRDVLPDLADLEGFDALIDLAIDAATGVALSRVALPGDPHSDRVRETLTDLLRSAAARLPTG